METGIFRSWLMIKVPQHWPLSDSHRRGYKRAGCYQLLHHTQATGRILRKGRRSRGKGFATGYFLNNLLKHGNVHVLNEQACTSTREDWMGRGVLHPLCRSHKTHPSLGDNNHRKGWGWGHRGCSWCFSLLWQPKPSTGTCSRGVCCAVTLAVFTRRGNASYLAQSLLLHVSKSDR